MKDNFDSKKNINSSSGPFDPEIVLQEAVEQIEVFTKTDTSLKIEENGRLVSVRSNGLEKIVNLARNFVAPIFSQQKRRKKKERLNLIKQGLLQARDTIQTHFLLIEKLKKGSPAQQKLAQSVLEAIKRYNAVVIQDRKTPLLKYDFSNFERKQLLLDEEIKGKEIRIHHPIFIQSDVLNEHPAQKTIKQLSQTLFESSDLKKIMTSTHKRSLQVMVDTFRMKVIRNIQHYFHSYSIGEILHRVNQSPIEIDENQVQNLVRMRQVIDISPGSALILSGSFKKRSNDSKLMGIPLLEEFHSNLQTTSTGFPLPSPFID